MESKMKIDRFGEEYWYNKKGQIHRLDGPAYENVDGYKEWCVDGMFHRLNGPAIDFPMATKKFAIGHKEWFINLSISYNPIMDNA